MSARIFVDLDTVHPVIDGTWHRARFRAFPQPGERIRMLCGTQADAEFGDMKERRETPGLRECESCTNAYRQLNGIAPVPRAR